MLSFVVAIALGATAYSSDHKPWTDSATKKVYTDYGSSVYTITSPLRGAGGTGFSLMLPNGRVVTMTNEHVCRLATDGILVAKSEFYAHEQSLVRVLARSPKTDLCILSAPSNAKPLVMAKLIRNGETLYSVGHPELRPLAVRAGKVTGPVHDEWARMDVAPADCHLPKFIWVADRCLEIIESLESTIETYPGNSGSPVVNRSGEVVGVIFACDQFHHGAFIPLQDIVEFVNSISN